MKINNGETIGKLDVHVSPGILTISGINRSNQKLSLQINCLGSDQIHFMFPHIQMFLQPYSINEMIIPYTGDSELCEIIGLFLLEGEIWMLAKKVHLAQANESDLVRGFEKLFTEPVALAIPSKSHLLPPFRIIGNYLVKPDPCMIIDVINGKFLCYGEKTNALRQFQIMEPDMALREQKIFELALAVVTLDDLLQLNHEMQMILEKIREIQVLADTLQIPIPMIATSEHLFQIPFKNLSQAVQAPFWNLIHYIKQWFTKSSFQLFTLNNSSGDPQHDFNN